MFAKKLKTVTGGLLSKKCCKNCHFLTKTTPSPGRNRFSWDANEREELEVPEHYTSECRKGIWSTGIDPHLNSRLSEILLEDRKDNCFYIEYHPGMSFGAAEELHRIRNDNRQLKKSYRYTQAGLWIAAISVVITAIPIAKPIIAELFSRLIKLF